jgi:hypothetical protein
MTNILIEMDITGSTSKKLKKIIKQKKIKNAQQKKSNKFWKTIEHKKKLRSKQINMRREIFFKKQMRIIDDQNYELDKDTDDDDKQMPECIYLVPKIHTAIPTANGMTDIDFVENCHKHFRIKGDTYSLFEKILTNMDYLTKKINHNDNYSFEEKIALIFSHRKITEQADCSCGKFTTFESEYDKKLGILTFSFHAPEYITKDFLLSEAGARFIKIDTFLVTTLVGYSDGYCVHIDVDIKPLLTNINHIRALYNFIYRSICNVHQERGIRVNTFYLYGNEDKDIIKIFDQLAVIADFYADLYCYCCNWVQIKGDTYYYEYRPIIDGDEY